MGDFHLLFFASFPGALRVGSITTSADESAESVLPSITDLSDMRWRVRFVPTTEVARLFDQLVGLAVSNPRIALPNFYNITIRIANVAARLAVLGLRLCDELGSSTSPKFIARLNICNADIHKAAD
jgi:hypothetical protein